MPRGRAATVQVEEPAPQIDKATELVPSKLDGTIEPLATYEVENAANDLDDVQLDAEDLYGSDDDDDDSEEIDSVSDGTTILKSLSQPKKTIEENTNVSVTYNGIRTGGRNPYAVTVIVPEDGTPADDKTALIEQGRTFHLILGQAVAATEEQAAWLRSHPAYDIT